MCTLFNKVLVFCQSAIILYVKNKLLCGCDPNGKEGMVRFLGDSPVNRMLWKRTKGTSCTQKKTDIYIFLITCSFKTGTLLPNSSVLKQIKIVENKLSETGSVVAEVEKKEEVSLENFHYEKKVISLWKRMQTSMEKFQRKTMELGMPKKD